MIGDALSEGVIGACIEVHENLGPGLYESIYEECLARELELRGLMFVRQVPVPISYKGMRLEVAFRVDFIVEERLIVELKAVEQILPLHYAQVRSYLRATDFRIGLLINFNVGRLVQGVRRVTPSNCEFLRLTSPPHPSP